MFKHIKWVLTLACLNASTSLAQESYSPYADRQFPENVYWADTHLHTNMLLGANGMGNITLKGWTGTSIDRSYAKTRSRREPLYEPDDAFSPNLAKIGYEKGVPMGGGPYQWS